MEECGDDDSREAAAQVAANFLNQDFPETTFGAPKAGYAKWASVIRVLNPVKVFWLLLHHISNICNNEFFNSACSALASWSHILDA